MKDEKVRFTRWVISEFLKDDRIESLSLDSVYDRVRLVMILSDTITKVEEKWNENEKE